MKYTIDNIPKAREKSDFLFFWGHRPKKDGSLGKGCLSQWYPKGFIHEGVHYSSAEHWMMVQKAIVFDDKKSIDLIIKAATPNEAKALGRKVANFDAKKWDAAAYQLVVEGNYLKFSQEPAFKDFLLSTEDKILVEASPVDTIWGIGMVADDPRAIDPQQWVGLNKLGFALMEVRDRLRLE